MTLLVRPSAIRAFARRFAQLALAVVILVAPSFAFADEALARAHFKKAIELYDKKHYEAALAEFQEAYKEKPSAGIKQNIALSLKALGRPVDAATSFDEALDEGTSTLKPETRAAIERELAELSKTIATVKLRAVTEDDKPVEGVTVSIQPRGGAPRALPPSALRRPIRLMPGIYTFTARAPGLPDPSDKTLALVSGPVVDAAFVFGSQRGTLTIRASVPDASIRVDGVEVGRGTWSGVVPAGPHKIVVAAPGWKTTEAEVAVTPNATVDYPVTLLALGEAPPEYVAPALKPVKPKKFYLVVTGALDGASYRLSDDLGEPASGTRRGFAGVAIGGRAGFRLAKSFALELFAEAGAATAKYKLRPSDTLDSETRALHWQLMPALRFTTPGKTRFAAATGFGPHGIGIESKLSGPGEPVTKRAQGIAFAWLVEAGLEVDLGPIFIDGALFLNVHGVGPVRGDDAPEGRFLLASPAVRGGLRLGLGIPL